MKDIDFDELDKAVSSLMGGVVKHEKEEELPKQKTLSISSTLGPDDKPKFDKLEAVAKTIGGDNSVSDEKLLVVKALEATSKDDEPVTDEREPSLKSEEDSPKPVEVKSPAPVIPKRPSSGRFMDVVHPSSDMKTQASTPNLVVPDRPAGEPEAVSAQPTEPALEASPPQIPVSAPVSRSEVEPLTPFLPDAKVEKRPLGGGPITVKSADEDSERLDAAESNPAEEKALEIAEIESINSEPISDTRDEDEQLPLDPVDFDSKLSEEERKLESIESKEVEADVPPTDESVRKVEAGDTVSTESESDAQQHSEKKKEKAAEESGDIFDTNNYHQLLSHPVKQKSGWTTVIIIFVIILICAALAGAAYFYLGING